MKHFSAIIESIDQLSEFLELETVRSAARSARSTLVQIYTGRLDEAWLARVIATMQATLPQAVIVGATSAGEISQGQVSEDAVMISIAFFQSGKLQSVAFDCTADNEYATGLCIAEAFHDIPDLKGVLLLAAPTRINCARLLEGVEHGLPDILVFGGGAAEILPAKRPCLFHHHDMYEAGCVAVALAGADLHIEHHVSLDWKAIGPSMTLTDVNGFQVRTIDGKTALDVYRRYLGIGANDDDIYLLEFPLLIDRHGTLLARNPVSSDENGYVTLVADVYPGETARLGYLDVDAVVSNLCGVLQSIEAFSPEAIFLYSCICRRFTLQEEVECETRPLQAAAPTAGFYTSGEFCSINNRLQLLNSSQVAVVLREGQAQPVAPLPDAATDKGKDRFRFRHARITSRLFQFITALTDEVEQANRLLQHQADHDALTGALNRRPLDTGIEEELLRCARYGRAMSIVMFDLDHFKRFNDEFGHAAGDHVLRNVVATVRETMRGSDTLYRYGGEEFLMLLPEATIAGALSAAEKARAAVEALTLRHDGKTLPTVTISLGVAGYPEHGGDSLSLLKAADTALYQAKETGRNRVSSAP